ncbi:MAG: hypothetical protein EXS46_03050 [Candidatus Taylorbacteria bacterium]|nr:hypothetical protein [Candidatus Taylorbacteria bacterium]
MLPSKQKVNKELFGLLMKTGRSFHSDIFSLRVSPSPDHSTSRFSVVVQKKVEKEATLRNRAKRRVYPIIKGLWKEVKPGLLGGIFLKKKITTYSTEVLRKEVENLFKKAGIV